MSAWGGNFWQRKGRSPWLRVVPAGVGVGFLTGFFGVGGGFVIVPALVLLLGLPMPVAVGTSLLVIALTSASALAAHLASGSIDWAIATAFTGAAVAGALAGSRLGARPRLRPTVRRLRPARARRRTPAEPARARVAGRLLLRQIRTRLSVGPEAARRSRLDDEAAGHLSGNGGSK